jgi:hypothetical protein
MKRIALALLVAMFVGLASFACGGASTGYDYLDEPRRTPLSKQCIDYANAREVLSDERAGKLTKTDKRWLDMDGDGRFCEEPDAEWKGEPLRAE